MSKSKDIIITNRYLPEMKGYIDAHCGIGDWFYKVTARITPQDCIDYLMQVPNAHLILIGSVKAVFQDKLMMLINEFGLNKRVLVIEDASIKIWGEK